MIYPRRLASRVPLRRPLIVAALAIGVFQLVDVFTTHRLLAHGFKELNPLAGILIAAGWLLAVKALLAAGFIGRSTRVRPTVGLLCATCVVAGCYFAIALGNAMALAR
jgi:hypothetical protein